MDGFKDGRRIEVRFIPAHAGNSQVWKGSATVITSRSVHPRACGELRALRDPIGRQSSGNRFIPAHAGNSTEPSGASLGTLPVHPRACGELAKFNQEYQT